MEVKLQNFPRRGVSRRQIEPMQRKQRSEHRKRGENCDLAPTSWADTVRIYEVRCGVPAIDCQNCGTFVAGRETIFAV